MQGSKKVSSGRPGRVDFPDGQVTFHSYLPSGHEPRQVACPLNRKKRQSNWLRQASNWPRQAEIERCLSKRQAGTQVVFKACNVLVGVFTDGQSMDYISRLAVDSKSIAEQYIGHVSVECRSSNDWHRLIHQLMCWSRHPVRYMIWRVLSAGQGHWAVFSGKTLYPHTGPSQHLCLHPPR